VSGNSFVELLQEENKARNQSSNARYGPKALGLVASIVLPSGARLIWGGEALKPGHHGASTRHLAVPHSWLGYHHDTTDGHK
jgi:hypothetical protein